MNKEIRFSGLSANPSDYNSLDGELAVATNIIYEDGALRPILKPSLELDLTTEQYDARSFSNVWLHQTSAFKNFIAASPYGLVWYPTTEEGMPIEFLTFPDGVYPLDITFIGNVGIVICNTGLYYFLWETETSAYKALGSKLPECPISFGLTGAETYYETNLSFSEQNNEDWSDRVMAATNKFIADNFTNAGYFLFPFLVRYAYRLYDGTTLTHHSAPILMMPSTYEAPIMLFPDSDDGDIPLYGIGATLNYMALLTNEQVEELMLWKDIISSVDIFISSPIYSYNYAGKVDGLSYREDINSCFVGNLDNGGYKIHDLKNLHTGFNYKVNLPMFDSTEIGAEVASRGLFYLLKSIPLEDISTTRSNILVPNDYLGALEAKEVMTDDYQTHDTISAKYAFPYNGRLNLANIKRDFFEGYHTASMVCFRGETPLGETSINTFLQADKGIAMVTNASTNVITQDPRSFKYLFYPDILAKEMYISRIGDTGEGVPLSPHPTLNGAVYFGGFPTAEAEDWRGALTYTTASQEATQSMPNKIYTSEINNPFHFPLTGINTVGVGEIYGIISAAKEMSPSQFGEFPLYAFTSEGVWALSVNAKGGYTSIQPFLSDIIISPQSLTQMDSSVAFATDRGIMILSGSQSVCISEMLENKNNFDATSLPHLEEVATLPIHYSDFAIFLQGCSIVFDYYGQRLIVCNANYSYAYVYSLESKCWGVMDSTSWNGRLWKKVKSYPEALVMDIGGYVVNLSIPAEQGKQQGVVVTRPMKLDAPDILKQITSVVQRGEFKRGSVQSILYGSRDMFNWQLITSSADHFLRGQRGTPYKYFQVALISELGREESISGCSIDFDFKQTNHTR